MKQDTFDKAQELQTNINDLTNAISRLEENKKDHNGFPLNFSFCFDDEMGKLNMAVMTYLKTRKKLLQKQFDNLK